MTASRVPGPVGMDTSEPRNGESGLLGGGEVPAPVGSQTDLPLEAEEQQKKPAASGVELSLVGSYRKPSTWTEEIEKKLAKNDTWFPHTLDFLKVAGKGSKEITSPEDFLLKIVEAKGSIRRLNFFSHGVMMRIATSGEVDPAGQFVKLDTGWNPVSGSIRMIAEPYAGVWGDEGQNSGSVTVTVGGRTFSLDDVRAKFSKDATLFLYICHGGVDPTLLQNISNTFQVTVKAFSQVIVYCVPSNFPTNRQHKVNVQTGAKPSDSCPPQSSSAVSDFHQLTPDRGASPKKP
jgi:hypothetical protein